MLHDHIARWRERESEDIMNLLFCGFMSPCKMPFEWQSNKPNDNPDMICPMLALGIRFLNTGCALMKASRSPRGKKSMKICRV